MTVPPEHCKTHTCVSAWQDLIAEVVTGLTVNCHCGCFSGDRLPPDMYDDDGRLVYYVLVKRHTDETGYKWYCE